ncbi:hypothetical protein GCM10010435_84390 [Winogradskya consettensis]|uniref:Uncharacterized protein n=1 Tax=Winogradskya consettensis TaxID=113560 RepID=A0A919W0P5_9ACTN|nr:hypothetical protein [Actinoplanes consettensis]GIM82065.1 hypothetical protein Aco04nite_79710 [Actinoplanes consettensis]
MTEQAIAGTTGFVAYEYRTIRADRELESLWRDSLHNFGWIVESAATPISRTTVVMLKVKRDRRIKNRPMVLELERKCESALSAIARMEKSKNTTATAVAATIAVLGSASLAGSIFTLNAGNQLVSIVLGAIGLLAWVAGYLAYGGVKGSRTAALAPRIDHEYSVVHETGEQGARLLS